MLINDTYTHKEHMELTPWFIPRGYKVLSKLSSIFHMLNYQITTQTTSPPPLHSSNISPQYETDTGEEGLIVYIHGLNSSPRIGETLYAKEIEKKAPGKYKIWVPKVPKNGNCSLQEAAEPILQEVRKYIEENPGKPVQLIGHSNGGRIAAYIDTHTRDLDVDMRVTGIAGVFFGTDVVKLGRILGISFLFVPRVLAKELSTDSSVAKNLIEEMKKPILVGSRKYTFYTTRDDLAIPNYTSCLPKIHQQEECVVKSRCSHNSIQLKVLPEEVAKVIDFMKSHYLVERTPLFAVV